MMRAKYIFLLTLVLLACGKSANYVSLTPEEFQSALQADSTIIRLDVRTAKEFAEGHIPQAINIDVKQADFCQQVKRIVPKGSIVAVNCKGGVRSKKAADILLSEGYKVLDLDSGFVCWQKHGLPIE